MAVFNPTPALGKDDMPNYFKYSAPISDIQADRSTALAVSTVATGLEQGAEVAERTAKEVIGEDVRNSVEPIRKDFTSQLQNVRDNVVTGTSPQQDSQPSVPTAVEGGIGKIDSLQSALINGKINDTYYHQRLDGAVTDLRARYPGFKDYIDSKVAQITGVNPANAVVSDLMQDINRAVTNRKTELDKEKDMARKAMGEFPGAEDQLSKLEKFGDAYVPTFRKWYSEEGMKSSSLKLQELRRKSAQGAKEDIATQRTEDWTNEVGSRVSSSLNSLTTIPGVDTPQGILKTMEDMAAHPDQYTDNQAKALATQIQVLKATFYKQATARALETAKDDSGRTYSYNSDIGANKTREVLDTVAGKAFDDISDALMKGGAAGAGLAFYHAHHAQGILDQSKDKLLSGPVGEDLAKMGNFNEIMGPTWTGLVVTQSLKNRIDDKLRTVLDVRSMDARTQPDFDKTGKPVTMEQHMREADKWQQEGKIDARMKGRYFNNLVNLVDDIKNPEAPDKDKINILKYVFSPEGQGVLAHINSDYTDPITKKYIPGKESVFTRLTSDDVVSEVSRLAKSDPNLAQMYKGYMEREAGSQLFMKDILNLNRYTGHDDLNFKYNNGDKGGVPFITIIDKDGKEVQTRPPTPGTYNTNSPSKDPEYLYRVKQVVDHLNGGLAGMSRVERGLGGDPNSYILDFMMRSQADLGKNWEGLPAKLVDAIAASRAPQRRIEDTFKDLKGK